MATNDERWKAANDYHHDTRNALREERKHTSTGAFWFGEDVIRAFVAGANWKPADDDTPLDEAWLLSVGFVRKAEWQAWVPGEWCDQCILLFRSPDMPNVWSMQYENDFHWPHDLRTRGEVRRLCYVLGIELKESK